MGNILDQIKTLQSQNKTIVMTNGCFDMVHAGHVAFLKQVAKLGDYFLLAINSDSSIKKLKGPTRPIYSESERIEILSSLACIDWVVVFDEDTPCELIKKYQPNILAKGGDYNPEEIVGHEIVTAYGGKTKIVPHDFSEISTTAIINKIKNYG